MVLSPKVGYGDDVEEGYNFVQSHLSNILSSLPFVYMCIPEGWEPAEIPERYKGMEGFDGKVLDGSREAWELFTCIDSSRMPPAVWDGHAVFKRISSMVHKTRMNGTERKGLSLLLMNDIVEEYETLSQIITVERREIERNCGAGVGGGGKVVVDKNLGSEWFGDAEAYIDGIITTDPKIGTQSCYGIEVISTGNSEGAGRMGWLVLSSSGYYPNRRGEEEDADTPPPPPQLDINKNSDAGVKDSEEGHERIKEYRRVASAFRSLGEDLRLANESCRGGDDYAMMYEGAVKARIGEEYEISVTLIGAEGLKGPSVRGAHMARIKVGNDSVVYGDTFDPLTGKRLTAGVDTFNAVANAPWEEWREDRLAAERMVEDRHSTYFKGLLVGEEGRGKWRVYLSDDEGDWVELDGYVRTSKGGVVLKSEVLGTLIIRYNINVRKYYRGKDYYDLEVVPDEDDGRENKETLHPVLGLMGAGMVDPGPDGGVWVRVYGEGMWDEWKEIGDYDNAVTKVWVDREDVSEETPERTIREMEVIKSREEKDEAGENRVEVSVVYGPSGGHMMSLVNELTPRFPKVLMFEFTTLSSYSDFDAKEVAHKIVAGGETTLIVVTSPFTTLPIIETLSKAPGMR